MSVFVLLEWLTHDGPERARVITDGDEAASWAAEQPYSRLVVSCEVDGAWWEEPNSD